MFSILLLGVFIDGEGILNLQNGAYTWMIITHWEEHDPVLYLELQFWKNVFLKMLAFCYLCRYCCTFKKEKRAKIYKNTWFRCQIRLWWIGGKQKLNVSNIIGSKTISKMKYQVGEWDITFKHEYYSKQNQPWF
jgi:hypothetical protein